MIRTYVTAADTPHRLSAGPPLQFQAGRQVLEREAAVVVDVERRFQTFLGIGGALTDAAAEVFAKLPPAKQEELLQAYFSPTQGIGYTLARVSIHSCDFSSASFTYVAEGDTELRTFDIQPDRAFRLPLIKRALAAAGGALRVFCSPWSPPAWMKDTGDMLHGGRLRPEYRQAWADYFVRFIAAYEAEGVPLWGLTVQNEPLASQKWESCLWTAEEERDFVKLFLGPTLGRAGLGDKRLIVWDHNRDLMLDRAATILGDPDAAKYVWGVGFHWYENWVAGHALYDNVRRVAEAFPTKALLFTEGCHEVFDAGKLQSFANAERYGEALINDFNNGTVGWTDWNILLDERGGPNHVGNFCFAPIHADLVRGELVYTPAYYYLGHFAKFLRPGARRVASSTTRPALHSVSFANPDGEVVTVVMNASDAAVECSLAARGGLVTFELLPHSIWTLVY